MLVGVEGWRWWLGCWGRGGGWGGGAGRVGQGGCDPFYCEGLTMELGEAGGGHGVWGEGVKWVVKGVGVRCVEGVDVHV